MISVLTFYCDDPSSNPTDVYSFYVMFVFEKNKNKQREAAVGPFRKRLTTGHTGILPLFVVISY